MANPVDPENFLIDGPTRARSTLILAHGAGAPMDSEFMARLAGLLAEAGLQVIRFEFPYMAERRQTGKKRPPNSQNTLLDCYRQVIAAVGEPARLVIGGKSMGGRMASMVADELGVRGLVCLGYPFHPPGQPTRLRTAHLQSLVTPALIVQGERDSFGGREDVPDYGLAAQIQFAWIPDGDHSLKPRVKSGHTMEENLGRATQAIADFVRRLA